MVRVDSYVPSLDAYVARDTHFLDVLVMIMHLFSLYWTIQLLIYLLLDEIFSEAQNEKK